MFISGVFCLLAATSGESGDGKQTSTVSNLQLSTSILVLFPVFLNVRIEFENRDVEMRRVVCLRKVLMALDMRFCI